MSSYENFVQCRIVTPLTASAIDVGVLATQAPYNLPPEGGGVLILCDSPGNPSKVEIIRYSHRTGMGLYGLQRGQEGTTAKEWIGNVYCIQALTSGEFVSQLDLKADKAVTLTAGNGLTGGGTLGADRTVTLGTPGAVTASSTNTVTDTGHTHALTLSKADIGLGNVNNTTDAAKPVSTAQQSALNLKVDKAIKVITGTGLDGGGDLTADRTLSVKYGTAAGTAAEGNDTRLSNSREWTASEVTKAEAEAGTATTARKWSAQRVSQAALAMLTASTTAFTRTLLLRSTATQVKMDLGLADVDNTSDANKPVSTAQQTALDLKVDKAGSVTSVAGRTGAVVVSKADVGLDNADNTSDMAKPVSTAQQTALNLKADTSIQVIAGTGLSGGGSLSADRTLDVQYGTTAGTAAQGNDSRLSNSREWTAADVSQAEAEAGTSTTARKWTAQRVRQAILGWWTGSPDKTKLDGIETGAQVNTVTSVADKTGVVTVTKADVGLSNVSNTSDADKPVSTAQQDALNLKLDADANAVSATRLETARTINGESFDGTADITIPVGVTEDTWYLGTDKQHTASATGAVALDLATASTFDLTLTGNTTLTVSNANVPAGETRSVVVRIRQGATARTLTWWAGITWLASKTPEAPAVNKIKEYVLSYDGSSWLGREGASN